MNAAIIVGPHGESLLIQTAASPGTASVLTKEFTSAAAALKTPLRVRDLASLPASDSTGISLFFLVIGWMLGGYVGATALALVLARLREAAQSAMDAGINVVDTAEVYSDGESEEIVGKALRGRREQRRPGHQGASAGAGRDAGRGRRSQPARQLQAVDHDRG